MRFTRHVTGSLPCMPARHDILCGALDFLWRPWGSIELWEEPITRRLRARRRDDDARDRPPAPVRDRRRELPHRLHRLGLRAGPRGRPVAHLSRPVLGGHAGPPGGAGGWYWQRARRRPGDGRATTGRAPGSGPRRTSRARGRWRRRPVARRGDAAPRPLVPRSSTSSTRTSRSTRPSRGSAATTTSRGSDDLLIWPPYADGAMRRRPARPSARAARSGPTTAPSCR